MDSQQVVQAIEQVRHPEINNTLVELGMVQGVEVDQDRVSLRLMLPILGIPAVVRDTMIQSLQQAASAQGASLEVSLGEMTPAERQRFFALEQQNWMA